MKKTLYPLNIPVPTIFKCNIDKYIPRACGTDLAEDNERTKRTANKEGISMESLSVFHDHYNYADISSCSASFFNDISVNINDLSNENSFDNITDCHGLNNITEEIQHSYYICRLCAKTYSSIEHLTDLTSKPDIYDTLDTILPNQVNEMLMYNDSIIFKWQIVF